MISIRKYIVTIMAGILVFLLAIDLSACTSFLLKTKGSLFFVHSLNQGNWKSVPGLIFFNQRNEWKKGYSWEALLTVGETEPSIVWQSQYGSVTFNPFGKEFPDGGMNEKGLYIWEMSLSKTNFPDDPNKPKLFMMQWMQYVLDNFSTVDEVVENAGRMSIDGWEWHFFIADESGKTAIIDFVDGRPAVYSGETMPVPICCNSNYSEAMEWLNVHQGFGGDVEIKQNFSEIPRFIYGAKLMQEYTDQDPVDYSFMMLDAMSENVRWSVVFDVKKSRVHFKTNLNQNIRSFTFGPGDFSRKNGPLMADIETAGPGDIKKEFTPYNEENDRALIKSVLQFFCQDPDERKRLLDDQNVDLDGLTVQLQKKVHVRKDEMDLRLAGDWEGKAKYPASGDFMEVDMILTLHKKGGQLSGSVNDKVLIKGLPIEKPVYKGGLLTFLIRAPDSGDLLRYNLFISSGGIRGTIDIFGERRRATLNLKR